MVRVGTTLSEPAAHARRRPLQTRRLTAAECISSVTPMLKCVCEETPDAIDLIDGFAFYLLTDKPEDRLKSGQTFAMSKEAPTFFIEKVPSRSAEGAPRD